MAKKRISCKSRGANGTQWDVKFGLYGLDEMGMLENTAEFETPVQTWTYDSTTAGTYDMSGEVQDVLDNM